MSECTHLIYPYHNFPLCIKSYIIKGVILSISIINGLVKQPISDHVH